MASFLDLPAETRLQIYSYMAIPDTTPFSAYHGLYLSCRQVRAEMDDECGKILGEYLPTIKPQARWNFISSPVMTIPGNFLAMQHIRLDLRHYPTQLLTRAHRSFFSRIMSTQFASVTIVLTKDPVKSKHLCQSLHMVLKQLPTDVGINMIRLESITGQGYTKKVSLYSRAGFLKRRSDSFP
ncbi:hypothetical protein KJE20_06218 [Pyrenophora tritici-repentis]|nr:hypothetical protein KJE20_06218 [Pyrenophora tritici-repentis]